MIVTSGYIEVNALDEVETVVSELNARNISVEAVNIDRVVFLVERETTAEIKASLDSLKDIEGVRSVYLAYYSLEGADRGSEDLLPFNTH